MKEEQHSRQYGGSPSSYHPVARGSSHRGGHSTVQQRPPREICRASHLYPRKRWAFASPLAVVCRRWYAATTSSVAPQCPWSQRHGQAANGLVGWNVVLGCGEGRSGGRRSCLPLLGMTRARRGEQRDISGDLESTVRLRGFGRSGICIRQREVSVEKSKTRIHTKTVFYTHLNARHC